MRKCPKIDKKTPVIENCIKLCDGLKIYKKKTPRMAQIKKKKQA